MIITRLGSLSLCLCRINRPTYLVLQRGAKQVTESLKKNEDEDDKPIPYSTTEAIKWKAQWNREPPPSPQVWYTPHVVFFSLISFMIYFCILREENDIDEILYRPLPETVKGIDQLYPEHFYTKPDFVIYHEKMKLEKQKAAEAKKKIKESTGRTNNKET